MAPVAGPKVEPANPIDTAGGAAGQDNSSFQVSKGGIIAIGVIVGVVVVLGAISTVLFILAKRRNWEVRKTIARMSKRLTGGAGSKNRERQSKRHGTVRLTSQPATTRAAPREKAPNVKDPGTRDPPTRTEAKAAAVMPPPYSEPRS